ncbi:putative disease resistance RPP13 protein 1 [Spatholobus suberectus]|nr:putative disease resistance RPP13 protein 1 [Spatholobus suberectus]
MGKLPSSIAKLSKLETLKLSRCNCLKELPKNFESLPQLKHLDMEGCVGLTHMPRKISKLTSLQTLSTFVASKSDPMGGLEELAKLNKLSGNLEILYLDRVQSLENRETKYLEEKQQLQRLTLRWDDTEVDEEKGKGHLALLNCLEPHPNLGALILVGYQGPSLSTWLTSSSIEFNCLVKLRLLNCSGCKYLSQQDQLPKLKILELVRLDNLEYVAQNCDKEAVFYTTLKELTITDCPNLKSWWQTEEDVFSRAKQNLIAEILSVQHFRGSFGVEIASHFFVSLISSHRNRDFTSSVPYSKQFLAYSKCLKLMGICIMMTF